MQIISATIHHFLMLGMSYLLLLRNNIPPPTTSCSIVFPFSWALARWVPTFPLYASNFLSQLRQIQFLRAMQASSSGTSILTILQRQAILFQMYLIHFFMPQSSTLPSRRYQIFRIFYQMEPNFLSQSFLRWVSNFFRALAKSPFCCLSLSMISFLKFDFYSLRASSLMRLRSFSSLSELSRFVGEEVQSWFSDLTAVVCPKFLEGEECYLKVMLLKCSSSNSILLSSSPIFEGLTPFLPQFPLLS